VGCVEQKPVVDSSGKAQIQPLLQGLFAPQLPPHVAEPFASLRNCRAETVPAQRTAVIIVENNTVFIVLCMHFSLLQLFGLFSWRLGQLGTPRTKPCPVRKQVTETTSGAPVKMTGPVDTTSGANRQSHPRRSATAGQKAFPHKVLR